MGSANVMSNVTFRFDISATVDSNLGIFMGIDDTDFYQNGTYVNYKSYVETSNGDFLTSDRTEHWLARQLDVTFEYQEPVGGMLVGETVRRHITDVFEAVN